MTNHFHACTELQILFLPYAIFPTKPQIPGTDKRAEGHNFSDTAFVEWIVICKITVCIFFLMEKRISNWNNF